MNMVKQFKWTDKDNPFQTGTLTLNAITMSLTLRDWANSCEVGETVELANSIYERLPDVFVGRG